MKIRYALVAALLAGGLLTAPAMAGVTGTGGGTTSNTSNTDKHYEIENHYRTVDAGTGSSDASTVITASGTRHEWVGAKWGGWRDTTDTTTTTVSGSLSDPSVQQAIAAANSSVKSDLYSESGRTGGGCGYDSGSSSYTVTEVSYSYSDYSFTGRQTVLDDTQSERTDLYSTDAIIVGDADAIGSMYAAQGSLDRSTQIDEYYTHHDTYTRERYTNYNTVTYYETNGTRTVSPIVLDLDGDGKIEASGGKYLPHLDSFDGSRLAMFDFHGNGFPVLTEWVGTNDGLLCRPNAKGTVDGTNLFGTSNGFLNGFDELSSLDANKSGAVEGNELSGLMVWVDANGNAKVDSSELKSLSDLGITSIGVSHDNLQGNFVRNGQSQKSFDWWPSVQECRKVDMAAR